MKGGLWTNLFSQNTDQLAYKSSEKNSQRLQKSALVIMNSIDLKVVRTRTQRERTFMYTFDVADLGWIDQMISCMDCMNHTVDTVQLHPSGFIFKSLIDFVEVDPEDGVTEYIKSIAYISMIMVYTY